VSVPARHYDLLAELLLDAVDDTRRPGPTTSETADQPPGEVVATAARATAAARGAQAGAVARERTRSGRLGPERALTAAAAVLETHGYEPARVSPRHLVLRNCPFHRLAEHSPELVCGINQAYCAGLLAGLDATDSVDAVLEPVAGRCCVQLYG
jgi:predicted ArsR family transcriptional regulator